MPGQEDAFVFIEITEHRIMEILWNSTAKHANHAKGNRESVIVG